MTQKSLKINNTLAPDFLGSEKKVGLLPQMQLPLKEIPRCFPFHSFTPKLRGSQLYVGLPEDSDQRTQEFKEWAAPLPQVGTHWSPAPNFPVGHFHHYVYSRPVPPSAQSHFPYSVQGAPPENVPANTPSTGNSPSESVSKEFHVKLSPRWRHSP